MNRPYAQPSELIVRIAAFLAALTGDRAPGSVHAEILQRLSEPDSDRRLAGVTTDRQEFEAAWTALACGQVESEEVWRSVILPAVVASSNTQSTKNNLELVTSLWLVARASLDDPASDEEVEDDTVAVTAGPARQSPTLTAPANGLVATSAVWAAPSAQRGWRLRRGVGVAAVLAIVVLLTSVLWWNRDRHTTDPAMSGDPIATSGPQPSSMPSSAGDFPTAPSVAPAGAAQPFPPAANAPAPAPTWTGPGPALPPSAPHSLTAANVGMHNAALQWQPPMDPGTGGVAYYRILRDGADIGWTAKSAVSVTGLAPATNYVFTVVAYNGAGLASPTSSPLTVTTSPPPNTGPPPGATALLATTPASPMALGQSFTVYGSGWPCAGVKVGVRLSGHTIAIGTIDSEGRFTAPVTVEYVDASTARVGVLDGGPDVVLRQGEWRLEVRLADPSACGNVASAIQITFS